MSSRRHRPAASFGEPAGAPRLPQARKRFGQHFLRDTPVLDSIVTALGPLTGKTVLEIGPGRGDLTGRLGELAARVGIEIVTSGPRSMPRTRHQPAK